MKSNSTNSSSTRSREDSIPEYLQSVHHRAGCRVSTIGDIPESDGDDSHVYDYELIISYSAATELEVINLFSPCRCRMFIGAYRIKVGIWKIGLKLEMK